MCLFYGSGRDTHSCYPSVLNTSSTHLIDSCIYKAFTAATTDWFFFQKDPPSIDRGPFFKEDWV